MASPGTAFLAAYLPWRRIAHRERLALVERNAATVDPQLEHAIAFLRKGLLIEERLVANVEARAASLPSADGSPAARAGESARDLSVNAAVAAHIAYLRVAAPGNPDLAAQAAAHARRVREGVAAVTQRLQGLGSVAVAEQAKALAAALGTLQTLEPTTTEGYRQLNELVQFMTTFFDEIAVQLDTPTPE